MSDLEPNPESQPTSSVSPTSFQLNLQTAVDMGEYEPEYLSRFPEFRELTPNMQFEFVRKGIENKRRQLRVQYAAVFNAPNYSKKPELEEAIKNIFDRLRKLQDDEERLAIQYSRLV